jgi:hypothetical protein
MKEGTTLGARAQSAIQRAAVLYKPRLATFNFFFTVHEETKNTESDTKKNMHKCALLKFLEKSLRNRPVINDYEAVTLCL